MIRRFLPIVITFLIAILVVIGLRVLVFSLITIPSTGQEPCLIRGDRVLVNRWAYGLRSPWHKQYHRFRASSPVKGDWIVFNHPGVERDARPDTSRLCVGQVLACPGDTVWMGNGGHVSPRRSYTHSCIWPLVVPSHGLGIRVTPWNQQLYALTIQRHEPLSAAIVCDSLCVDGQLVDRYVFQGNYYWVASGDEHNLYDSRAFGFVPEEFILGQMQTILFSLDDTLQWYKRFRMNRFFKPVGGE